MESFIPGYRLQKEDLNVSFYAQGISYPAAIAYPYSPYHLSYEIGYIHPDGRILRVGPLDRIPEKVSTGVFRANFIVEEVWATGVYQITWKYNTSATTDTATKLQQFEVLSNGLNSILFEILFSYRNMTGNFVVLEEAHDLPGSFVVLQNAQDLMASLEIIP